MLLIDDRIGAKEMFATVSCPARITRLEFADAFITGKGPDGVPVLVGVERKRIGDLVSSIDSGRLAGHQLTGLTNSYHEVYLLIEGVWRAGPNGEIVSLQGKTFKPLFRKGPTHWSYQSVVKYLNDLMIQRGFHVWQTSDLSETGKYITHLHNWWAAPFESHTALNQFYKVKPPTEDSILLRPSFFRRAVAELDGIGWKKSLKIVEYFKSFDRLAQATVKELKEAPGIGKILAESIYKELREEE